MRPAVLVIAASLLTIGVYWVWKEGSKDSLQKQVDLLALQLDNYRNETNYELSNNHAALHSENERLRNETSRLGEAHRAEVDRLVQEKKRLGDEIQRLTAEYNSFFKDKVDLNDPRRREVESVARHNAGLSEELAKCRNQNETAVPLVAGCCAPPRFRHVLLGLGTLTAGKQYLRRNNIRKTYMKWCNMEPDCSMFFFVTGTNAAQDPLLQQEAARYQDMIFLGVQDWHDDHMGHMWFFTMFDYLTNRSRAELNEDFYADYWMWVDSDTYLCTMHQLVALRRGELARERACNAMLVFRKGILFFDGPAILISGDFIRWWFRPEFRSQLMCGWGGYDHGLGFWIMQYYAANPDAKYDFRMSSHGTARFSGTESYCQQFRYMHGMKDEAMLMLDAHQEWPLVYPIRDDFGRTDETPSMKTLNTTLHCWPHTMDPTTECGYWNTYIERDKMEPCVTYPIPKPVDNIIKTGTLSDQTYHCICVDFDHHPPPPSIVCEQESPSPSPSPVPAPSPA